MKLSDAENAWRNKAAQASMARLGIPSPRSLHAWITRTASGETTIVSLRDDGSCVLGVVNSRGQAVAIVRRGELIELRDDINAALDDLTW